MSRTEYKTVAMPQLMRGRRRRGQSRGEMIAETLSRVINEQGQSGWKYVRADHFKTMERASLLRGSEEVVYTVLVFERQLGDRGVMAEPPMMAEPEPAHRERRQREPVAREPGHREPAHREPTSRDPIHREPEPRSRARRSEPKESEAASRRREPIEDESVRRRPGGGEFVRRRQIFDDR